MTTSKPPIPYEEAFDLRKTNSIHLALQALISFIVLLFCMEQLLVKTTNPALYWGESPVSLPGGCLALEKRLESVNRSL